ncbi:MAG: cell division protein ZapA [Leptospiraceae bacterium]|nr:cell division protein ZapA [Leptospiraceae bacterium]
MPESSRVEANIFGSDYTIAGDASEEYIRSITVFVDNKMRELAKVLPNASALKIAVLTAINITDEMFQLKESPDSEYNAKIVHEYNEKTKKLISMLDKSLIGD